jgi:small-conductance mechanosensitive channel
MLIQNIVDAVIGFFDMLPWLPPALFIVGGLVLGIIFEKIVLKKVNKFVAKTDWEVDDFLIQSLKGVTVLFFVVGGIYGALAYFDLPEKTDDIANKTLLVILILAITIVAARIAVGLTQYYSNRLKGEFPSSSILTNVIYGLVLIIGVLIILQSLGISIAPLLTALGVGGLAAALALQDTLSNVFAGIQIIISGQIRPGDYIELSGGEAGYITDISWRYTVIRAISNNMIIVPNSKLSTSIITNYHKPQHEMSVLMPVGVAYDSDLEHVERVVIEVAKEVMQEVDGGVPDYEPLVRYNEFGDSSINFNIVMRTQEFTSQYLLRHEFSKRLHRRFNQEGIEIPFPIRTIYMADDGDDTPK